MAGPRVSAGLASTACPATVKTAGRWSRRISSITAPPTTWRVTTNGASPPKDTTLAAIATPSRAATWASTSVPSGAAAGQHDDRAGGRAGGLDGGGVRGGGVRREGVAGGLVDVADAVGRQRRRPSTSPTATTSMAMPPPAARQGPRQRQGLAGDLGDSEPSASLST